MQFHKFVVSACIAGVVLTAAARAESGGIQEAEVLEIAEQVGHWLDGNSHEVEHGLSWPDDVLNPETSGYDLGSGVAGKVLFFVALHNATGNRRYLQQAERGAAYLVDLLQDSSNFEDNRRRASLYSGVSGIGVALLNLQRASPRQDYTDAIEAILTMLEEWAVSEHSGLHWSDEFNDLLFGEAGTVLFLSFVAEQTGSERALEMATAGARFLADQAQPAEAGSYWYFRRGKDFNLPNFSHGAAGIGYVLASVAEVSGDNDFREAAKDAFLYLASVALDRDGKFLLPYGWGSESWDGLYEFGWAHGLAGSALFLERLRQADIESNSAREMLQSLRRTLLNINLPGTPTAPFGEPATPLDIRFGRAGVLSLLSEWGRDDDSVATSRDEIWVHIRDAAINDEQGVHWEVDAPGFMGGGRAAYTGYLHGAAGIGLVALKLHAALTGSQPYILMPDDPFTWTPGPITR